MFHFKQFSVDQTNCAMKINTDGVLLGALAETKAPRNILDIGTGTGVIALMLAQRFEHAKIDAVEIDELAAQTALDNFNRSIFSERLKVYAVGFEAFFETQSGKKYDLIVSNPPFYINSLHSPEEKKQLAKHTNSSFFSAMLNAVSKHLNTTGTCWIILPLNTAVLVKTLLVKFGLRIEMTIHVRSFHNKGPHREIMVLTHSVDTSSTHDFIIYDAERVHSCQYKNALKDFFTIF